MRPFRKSSRIPEILKLTRFSEYTESLKSKANAKSTEERLQECKAKREKRINLEGKREITVYTYDSKPLGGIFIGQSFYAEIDDKPTKLKSTLNGNVYDSMRDGGIVLSRKGAPFGVMWGLEDLFHRAINKGDSVKLKVMLTGVYEAHIPTAVALVPEYYDIKAWLDHCDILGKNMTFAEWEKLNRITILLEEGQLKTPHLPVGRVQLSTEWLQTAKGSIAKPHIAVSIDGTVSAEVSAAKRCYNTLSQHVGETPFLALCRKLERNAKRDKNLWKIEIMYVSK